MKNILKAVATIILLGAVVFLGGTWPADATRAHILLCDGGAGLLIILCSAYLRWSGAFEKEGE